MTPHKSHGRGTFRLDRHFAPIGRINAASGTEDPAIFRAINGMITTLYRTGRWDLLRSLRDHHFKPLELLQAFTQGALADLPSADEIAPLEPAVERWLAGFAGSERHVERYRGLFASLTTADARVRDLPGLVERYRARCLRDRHPRSFNLARAGAHAFVRDVFGRQHRLWAEVNRIATLRVTPRLGRKLTVADVATIAGKLGGYGAEWWSLCLTGMRRSEYWGRWTIADGQIAVHGTKSRAAERVIPLAFPIIRPRIGHWGFGQVLRKATDGALRPHDARHTCMHWMELARIPRIRRKLYLGHSTTRDISELYEAHEVEAFLAEDAERLRVFVGEAPGQMLQAVSA